MWIFWLAYACGVVLMWIAQWLDWQYGLEHPSMRIRVSHNWN
jgi:hypothetical protein